DQPRLNLHEPVDDHRIADAGTVAQRRLDLAKLDAMASQLDLVVDPSEEVQLPTGMPAGEVTRAIESLARPHAERIGNEALGGDVGLVEVATRPTGASGVDLADQPR